jgi:hypothetical protein
MIDFPTADREDLRLGSIVKFIVGDTNASHPRTAAVRIVGIVASPGQFPAVGASSASGSVYVTPAFVASNGIQPSSGDASLLIRLRHGAAGGEAFLRHKAAAGLGTVDIPEVQQVQTAGIQRSIRLESQALRALCVLTGPAAARPHWHFLTGSPQQIKRVVRDQYHVAYWKVAGAEEGAEQGNALAERANVGYDIKHSDVTYVIDGNGTIQHLFTGKNAATTATLLNAIRRAHGG